MKRIPIVVQLSIIFGVTLVLLISLLGATIHEFRSASNAYQNMLSGPVPRTLALQKAQEDFHEGLSELRGFVGYGSENYAADALKHFRESSEAVKHFTATVTAAESKQLGEKLQAVLASYMEDVNKIIVMKKNNDPNLNAWLTVTRQKTTVVNNLFEDAIRTQNAALKHRIDQLNDRQDFVLNLIIGFSAIGSVAISGCLFWFSRKLAGRINALRGELLAVSGLDLSRPDIHARQNDEIGDMAEAIVAMKTALRDIVRQVRGDADMLAASSEELSLAVGEQLQASDTIAKTSSDIAAGSVQNTNNITEISAVIEQVNAGAEEMNASTGVVNSITHKAVADAHNGMQLIQKVVSQNVTIEKSMQNITAVSSSLVKGSTDIQEIITVIRNIAGQTNLLALNAAIEAARAGDAGRGFAVVAEEVRKLAEQSAAATNHIGEIINKMTADIQFSVDVVNKANPEVAQGKIAAAEAQQGFEAIIDKLEQVRAGMDQISQAVAETAQGMQSIVENVQNISAVAEETGASTQTVAAAAEEQNASLNEVSSNAAALANMASQLNEISRKFKI
jgi:methyl-accepting chemotaxis protein